MQTNLLLISQLPSPVNIVDAPGLSYRELRTKLKQLETDLRMRYSLHGGKLYFLGDADKIIDSLRKAGCRLGNLTSDELSMEDLIRDPRPYKPILYQVLEAFFHFKGFDRAGMRGSSVYIADQMIADRKLIKPWGRYRPEGRSAIMPYDDFVRRNDEPGRQRRAVVRKDLFVHEGFNYHIETIDDNAYLAIVPRTFITQHRTTLLVGPGYSGLYTTINYNRHNWEIRTLLNYWLEYLADDKLNRYMRNQVQPAEAAQGIAIPAAGGGILGLNASFETAEEDLRGKLI